nr:PREDICTED: uncharacterized protein LOC108194661 [Daucus carota subsp. sativus]
MASSTQTVTSDTEIIHLNAPTHLPTKLTQNNFPVWSTQVKSTLIGLGVISYIDGTVKIPAQFLKDNVPNPAFVVWNRQDKIILSALLGSCHETIQPLVSTALSAKEMWERIVIMFANKSRSRVMSLKSHLLSNPCGSRPISEYLRDIRTTADELAIAGHPMADDDLVLLTLNGLSDEYSNIRSAIKVREAPMTFAALHEQLVDHERGLKNKVLEPTVVTANFTQKDALMAPTLAETISNISTSRLSPISKITVPIVNFVNAKDMPPKSADN